MSKKHIPLRDTISLATDLYNIDYKPNDELKTYLLTHPAVNYYHTKNSKTRHLNTPQIIVNSPYKLEQAFKNYIRNKENQINTGREEYRERRAIQLGLPIPKRRKTNEIPERASVIFTGTLTPIEEREDPTEGLRELLSGEVKEIRTNPDPAVGLSNDMVRIKPTAVAEEVPEGSLFSGLFDEEEQPEEEYPAPELTDEQYDTLFGNLYNEPDEEEIQGVGIVNVFSEFIKTTADELDTDYENVLTKFWTNKGLQRRWKLYKKTLAPTLFVPEQMKPQPKEYQPLQFNIPAVEVEPYTTDYSQPKVINLQEVYGIKPKRKQKAPVVERPKANIVLEMAPEPVEEFEEIIPVPSKYAMAPSPAEMIEKARRRKAKESAQPPPEPEQPPEPPQPPPRMEKVERNLTPVEQNIMRQYLIALRDARNTLNDNQWTWESMGKWDKVREWQAKIARIQQQIQDLKFMNVEGSGLSNSKVQSVIFRKDKWTPAKATKWLSKHNYANKGLDEKDEHLRFRQLNPDYIRRQGYKRFITKPLSDSGVSLIIAYK